MQVSFLAIIPIVMSQILSKSDSNNSGTSITEFSVFLASSIILGTTYSLVSLSSSSFFILSKNIVSASFFLFISWFCCNISLPNSSIIFL